MKLVLTRTEIGRSIISKYKDEGHLEDRTRQLLCQLLADYFILEKNIKPGVTLCRTLTQQILLIFPKEIYVRSHYMILYIHDNFINNYFIFTANIFGTPRRSRSTG